MGERLLRLRAVLKQIPIGKTNLDENFVKTGRLRKIQIGPRTVAFAESNVQEIVAEIIAGSDSVAAIMPAPNLKRRDAAASNKKRRRTA
jgi:predicted DNA-binding transcriptional regulator AlpA